MKVYLVCFHMPHEGFTIENSFLSKKKADKVCEEKQQELLKDGNDYDYYRVHVVNVDVEE
jgi:hypothetical protein